MFGYKVVFVQVLAFLDFILHWERELPFIFYVCY